VRVKVRKGIAQAAGIGLMLGLLAGAGRVSAASMEDWFRDGTAAYAVGDYAQAARAFSTAASQKPGSGTLQNLGNAEWQRGRTGPAILAWEQALWLNPFNGSAKSNLRYARRAAQLESPDLTWYEVVSSWLPVTWWAWIAGVSFWLAVGIGALPGLLRFRKLVWHQAVAAFALAVFLLSVPAQVGVDTRSRLGFVLQRDTPLRLTPTEEAQFITRLPAGEPARLQQVRGAFALVRTGHTRGWVERNQFALMCPRDGRNAQRIGAESPMAVR